MVGGGNTAIDAARAAWRMGSEVTVLYRRVREDMPAIPNEVEEAEREGVKFTFLAAPAKVLGRREDSRGGSALNQTGETGCQREKDAHARFGGRISIKADSPDPGPGGKGRPFFSPRGTLMYRNGRIAVDPWGRTSLARWFAGGDAAPGGGFVSQAIASGKRGAEAIDRFLKGKRKSGEDRGKPSGSRISIWIIFPGPAGSGLRSSPAKGRKGFKEIHRGFPRESPPGSGALFQLRELHPMQRLSAWFAPTWPFPLPRKRTGT